jgi:RNA polymerase sigma factor (sigma-70 family)
MSERAHDAQVIGAAMRQEFLDFFVAEHTLVVLFLMRQGARLPDAEDAVQHMAVQGWRKACEGAWKEVRRPRAWARMVALNHYRAQRQKRPWAEVSLEVAAAFATAGPGHAELVGQAHDAVALLQRLPPDQRAVIAFDLDGIPSDQIAAALGTTSRRVRDLRQAARRKLKDLRCEPTRPEGGNRS